VISDVVTLVNWALLATPELHRWEHFGIATTLIFIGEQKLVAVLIIRCLAAREELPTEVVQA